MMSACDQGGDGRREPGNVADMDEPAETAAARLILAGFWGWFERVVTGRHADWVAWALIAGAIAYWAANIAWSLLERR